jgi:hypothetical protein
MPVKLPPDDRFAALPEFIDRNRNLEDRMRELCQQLATSPDDCDLDQIRQELLCLSHEKLSRLRNVPIELPEGKFLATRRVSRC